MKKTNMSIAAIITLLAAAFFGLDFYSDDQQGQSSSSSKVLPQQQPANHSSKSTADEDGLMLIRKAYDRQQSNLQVKASGRVKAVLADDNQGSRHQKFILSLANGLTVLVAHNIDLAPRVKNIQQGDEVEFYGEYEYSDKGGVIHWTHHDPQNRHLGGWLKHQGRTYQ